LGTPDGIIHTVQGNLIPVGSNGGNPSQIKLFQGNSEIAIDQTTSMTLTQKGAVKMFSKVDYLTGAITVACRTELTEQAGVGDGANTQFVHVCAQPILLALAGSSDVSVVVKVATRSVGSIMAHGVLKFAQAPLDGGSVAVNTGTNSITIIFATAPAANEVIEVLYSTSQPFPTPGDIIAKCEVDYPNLRNTNGLTQRVIPGWGYAGVITNLVNDYLLINFGRAMANNQGYMPGLICIRAPFRDTWTTLYKDLIVEGKGICNVFMMFVGTTSAAGGRNPYETIALHECGHSLYFQHYDSGYAAGPRSDLHDMWDNCFMGYGRSEKDLCGQCIANYMGLNVKDPRFLTYVNAVNGAEFKMPDPTLLTSGVSG